MKKHIVLLLLSIGICLSVNSQNWCPPGAKWHYSWWAGGLGLNAMITYEYKKDTSVAGQICKQINGTFYGYWGTTDYTKPPRIDPNFRNYYTYENNKVVYAFNGNSFDTIVNFNANIGDRWLPHSHVSCNTPSPIMVNGTGHVSINNVNLKLIVLTYSTNFGSTIPTQTASQTYTMIEKIGNLTSIKMYADMFPAFCYQSPGVNDNPTTSFKCYQDNNFPLHEITPSACNNVLGLDGQNQLIKNIQIYPNPNAGHFAINISEPSRIIINNSIGQMVFEDRFDGVGEHKINLSHLQNGIYFMNVTNANYDTNLKFIKE